MQFVSRKEKKRSGVLSESVNVSIKSEMMNVDWPHIVRNLEWFIA